MSSNLILFYGTQWCGDCYIARRTLDRNGVPYEYIDINENQDGRAFVEKVNRGMRSVPTIVFPDGDILVEPWPDELIRKVNSLPK